jgi:predicted ferric reductase
LICRVAISNLALVTCLSLKNTPLAFLTTYSYEKLNILHQTAGYGFVCWVMTHAIVYCTAWSRSHTLHDMLEKTQIMGMVAGTSTLIMLASALFLRRLKYELFYIIHIVFFMLIVFAVGMHRPVFVQHAIIATIFIGCIWAADRIIRFAKISYFSFGNAAIIKPLPHGGTRIVLRKSSSYAVPGSHAFLWIPKIRAAETHPFTIVSTKPLEFVVAAYDGFTRDLHTYAKKHPGAVLKASMDGPYGNVPDFTEFTKVVFIAGGSGASFTAGAAVDLIRKLGDSRTTVIEFIWSVRDQGSSLYPLGSS